MMFKFFFDKKFEQSVYALGFSEFGSAIDIGELATIRDHSKNVLGQNPQDAAVRAFRELILNNDEIPIEQRVEKSFSILQRMLSDGKAFSKLYKDTKASVEHLICQYVGSKFENEFYDCLKERGVLVPIKHYQLRSIAIVTLYLKKKSNATPDDTAYDFFMDVMVKNADKYAGCMREEARGLLAVLSPMITH